MQPDAAARRADEARARFNAETRAAEVRNAALLRSGRSVVGGQGGGLPVAQSSGEQPISNRKRKRMKFQARMAAKREEKKQKKEAAGTARGWSGAGK